MITLFDSHCVRKSSRFAEGLWRPIAPEGWPLPMAQATGADLAWWAQNSPRNAQGEPTAIVPVFVIEPTNAPPWNAQRYEATPFMVVDTRDDTVLGYFRTREAAQAAADKAHFELHFPGWREVVAEAMDPVHRYEEPELAEARIRTHG